MSTITPTKHEKAEWARLAQAAYRAARHVTGHRFSAAAALPADAPMLITRFDALQADYRSWLIGGFAGQEGHASAA